MRLLRALCSLFFPRCCPMCGIYIGEQYEEGQLCPACLATLPRTEQAMMRGNMTEMSLTGSNSLYVRDSGMLMVRTKKTMHLDKAAAYLFFEKAHPIQTLIHKMKYAEQPMIGYYLGREAAKEFLYTDFFDGIELIVPMPLHLKRLRTRGYNQSEYIARGISDITGIPVDTTHVVRVRDTPKQAQQRGDTRKTNVADAFAVLHPEQLYRKHILVVDDLLTTGETMKSCLRSMRVIRGAVFSVFALCKAR